MLGEKMLSCPWQWPVACGPPVGTSTIGGVSGPSGSRDLGAAPAGMETPGTECHPAPGLCACYFLQEKWGAGFINE